MPRESAASAIGDKHQAGEEVKVQQISNFHKNGSFYVGSILCLVPSETAIAGFVLWRAVSQWLEHRTLKPKNPGSIPIVLCRTVNTFFHSTMF